VTVNLSCLRCAGVAAPNERRRVGVALVETLVLLMSATTICAAQGVLPRNDTMPTVPHTQDAAEHAKYTCASFSDAAAKAHAAAVLSVQTSDENALACAADLRFELANAAATDRAARIDALASLLSYVDHVRLLKVYELSQIDWPEYDLRLEHGATLAAKLIPAARKQWPADAAVLILCAAIERSLAGPTDPEKAITAVEELKRAVAIDPKALGGLGQLYIGRTYLDLPPIFGGGADKAIPYLTAARDAAPDDPRALRSLTEAYDALGRSSEALASLKALANVTPRDSDLQLYADEWRMGEGLATRLHSPELVASFSAKRADLMHQHPKLLSRKVESVWGHGETNPLSGISDYDDTKHSPR
jgi:tetratricopeptide (TPR) repeat protein